MTLRDELLGAGRKAAEVLDAAGARRRVESGYTRIDPFAVAALDGVPVLVRPMDRLLGAFLREERPGIIINAERPVGLVHMTCAHELGHYYLGHQTTTDHTIDYGSTANLQERQADWFAYMLMMPRWLLAKLMQRKGWSAGSLVDAAVIYQLSLRVGMSYTGTIWSLQRQGLIRLEQAQQLLRVQPADIKRRLAPDADLDSIGNQDVWLLDTRDRDLVLEPRANDKFVVDLPSRASAGYLWSLSEAADEGFQLRPLLVDGLREAPPNDARPVGGLRSLRYTLERTGATPVGDAHLEFRESQPWRPADGTNPSFGLTAQFETISLGLTPESKERLVEGVAAG